MSLQLFILILATFSTYYMVGSAFSMSYSITKFFNLSFAVDIVYAAYFYKIFHYQIKLNLIFAIVISILICIIFQLSLFKLVYSKIKDSNGFFRLIASIGILAIMQNILSIFFGDSTVLNNLSQNRSIVWGDSIITTNQLTLIIIAFFVFISQYILFKYSSVGKRLKACSSNKSLSEIFGIKSDHVELISILLSSIIFSLTGMIYSFYTVLNPTYGFDLLLYGIIAMIIGGADSTWGIVAGAFLLAMAQHLGAYFIDSKWMDAIAYLVLILFLIWKPLGFSGKRLKKVEI